MPRQAPAPPELEHVPWEQFIASRFRWQQGEHVSLIGPTGTGKTTLGMSLLSHRAYVAALGTKPKDENLDKLRALGYRRTLSLPERGNPPRVLVWPTYRTAADRANQRLVLGSALGQAFRAGSWCLFADEVSYLSRRLRLDDALLDVWEQGRSNRVSLVAATQRPAWVPLALYSAASHLFLWRTNDGRDLARIGGLNGVDPAPIRAAVANLPRFHALYVNVREGDMLTTIAPKEVSTR